MKGSRHIILYVPAEMFPTHHSLMTEVYSKNDYPVTTVFLMRHEIKELEDSMQSWNKAKVYLFPRESRFKIINAIKRYFRLDLRYLYLIPRIVIKHGVTIIQVRDLTFPLLLALLVKIFTKQKVIYQKSFPHEYWKIEEAVAIPYKFPWLVRASTQWENRILHYLMRFCDVIFPISEHMAGYLHNDYGLPLRKMHPLGLGFNFENIANFEHGGHSRIQDRVKLIYVGTLSVSREFEVLLHGLARTINSIVGRRIEIEFVGGTAQEVDFLKDLARDLSIDKNCQFTGNVDRQEVYKRIFDSDIGISWFGSDMRFIDASPTKMIEYLSIGIPVIAVDSVKEHLNILKYTHAGVICKVDKDDFYRNLSVLVSNYAVYRRAAVSSVVYMKKKYSYDRILNDIVDVYDELYAGVK